LKGDAAGFRAYLGKTGATICGRNGISTLLELLPKIAPGGGATLLAHWASGEMPGVRDDSSVDYLSMAFTHEPGGSGPPLVTAPVSEAVPVDAPPLPEKVGAAMVKVARGTLELDLASKPETLSKALHSLEGRPEANRLGAVFVTLKNTDPREIARVGDLRGCIGQVVPTHPLDLAVVTSARDAAIHDPRFPAVEAREIASLSVEVTVLSPIRPIGSWKDILIGTHGIVLQKGGRRALFLPQVAPEQGWTLEQTLDHLAAKAGLSSGEWRTGTSFSVFTGQVFHEARGR
jgi:AmmeMemoRadiSam system protein A